MNWRNLAACRGTDPNLFHPGLGDSVSLNKALAICASCPVTRACLDFAQEAEAESGYVIGIYGGTSANQRRRKRIETPGWDRSAPFASLISALMIAEGETAA